MDYSDPVNDQTAFRFARDFTRALFSSVLLVDRITKFVTFKLFLQARFNGARSYVLLHSKVAPFRCNHQVGTRPLSRFWGHELWVKRLNVQLLM